jgi:hypothetical protein
MLSSTFSTLGLHAHPRRAQHSRDVRRTQHDSTSPCRPWRRARARTWQAHPLEHVSARALGRHRGHGLLQHRGAQGLANALIVQRDATANDNGRVQRLKRIGGVLSFYHRAAA